MLDSRSNTEPLQIARPSMPRRLPKSAPTHTPPRTPTPPPYPGTAGTVGPGADHFPITFGHNAELKKVLMLVEVAGLPAPVQLIFEPQDAEHCAEQLKLRAKLAREGH